MADVLGADIPIPDISVTGFFSSSWVYVAAIAVFGVVLIAAIFILLFLSAYNKKVVVFENISGLGYQPVLKTRARTIKLEVGGTEILKTLARGYYLSTYGKKMGKNTFWFAKGSDGFLYNIVLGDLDTKMAMLDIEPIDRDVRMFHVAVNQLNQNTYNKKSFMEKYGIHLMLFFFLITLVLGIWFIVGKVGDATSSLSSTAETNKEVAQANKDVLVSLNNILNEPGQGLVKAGG